MERQMLNLSSNVLAAKVCQDSLSNNNLKHFCHQNVNQLYLISWVLDHFKTTLLDHKHDYIGSVYREQLNPSGAWCCHRVHIKVCDPWKIIKAKQISYNVKQGYWNTHIWYCNRSPTCYDTILRNHSNERLEGKRSENADFADVFVWAAAQRPSLPVANAQVRAVTCEKSFLERARVCLLSPAWWSEDSQLSGSY